MSSFLVLLGIEVFVFGPLARAEGSLVSIINGVVYSFLLLLGVLAMAHRTYVQIVSSIIVVLAVVLRWTANLNGSLEFNFWDKVASLACTLVFLVLVLRQIYLESPATVHKIRGAVAAYLLLAITFSYIYNLVELLHPGAFAAASSTALNPHRVDAFLYFSVTTLTTAGFGDITAVHPMARSLVMLESIIGILYPPILIGVLVALHTEVLRGRDQNGNGDGI